MQCWNCLYRSCMIGVVEIKYIYNRFIFIEINYKTIMLELTITKLYKVTNRLNIKRNAET